MVAFCAIASSPAWHRRCRKHRSSARRRLRQGSSTRRDRKLLLVHHATPPSQALVLMAWRGFTGKGAGSKGDNGPSKGSGKWQYWPGSWSPSTHSKGAPWKKNHGKTQDGKASLSFPGYDVARKEEQPISEVATIKERDGDSYATALQRAINHVRKAEARTRKALADKKSRTVQWNNWVAELKRTFAKEKGRHQTAVSRLEREMEEALVEQECARAGLRRVAASMEADAGPAGSDPYMVSPSTTSRRSSPATSTRKKISTPDSNGREGVKAAVRPVAPKHMIQASQSLADKLEARRAALATERPDLRSLDSSGSLMPLPQGLRRFLLLSLGSHHRHFPNTTSSTTTRRSESHQNQIWKPQDLQTLE